ncbi:MAG TPA: peptidylprolyl isomerase [Acidimicrobiales bacterium]|nr:peptidylprolyl isomerase [Acidimicrobiales bacterium]
MPAPKRQRQRSSRARQAAMVAARRRSTRRRAIGVAVFLIILLVLGVVAVVSGGSSRDDKKVAADAGAGGCPQAKPPQRTYPTSPPIGIDPAKTYTAEIKTNQGTMVAQLDPKKALNTVNNFVFLARNHYYDCLNFHRVVPGFVLQGGDPAGDGSGGPGYKFNDELPQAGEYKVGSLAMANSGPNTNGSQFFVISGPQGEVLPPQYSLFGQVTEGLDVVTKIDALGTPSAPNTPREPVTIESMTIKES